MKERIIVAMVKNEPGVLEKIAWLYRSRWFNIKSLTVGESETDGFSRMTIVIEIKEKDETEQQKRSAQALVQLKKQIYVHSASDVTEENYASQEIALIKLIVKSEAELSRIIQLVQNFDFDAKVIKVGQKTLTLRITGEDEGEINHAIRSLQKDFNLKIESIARSGLVALE